MAVAVFGGFVGSQVDFAAMTQPAAAQLAAERPTIAQGRQTAADLSVAFRDVISRVQPAVVSVRTDTKALQAQSGPSAEQRRMLEELQRRFGRGFEFDVPDRPRSGMGSGFIIDGTKGIVLTNNHVVEGADRVTVTLDDGRKLRATDWRTDPRSDVAVLFLDPDDFSTPLPEVALGDSEAMEIGDWVLAIGNPFGIGMTSTQGIISGKNRMAGLNQRENYLQTDAAVNPGNSGGPLVNLQGKVIGINTAIRSESGGYDGVSFAIPSRMVRWVSQSLIDNGTVERSFLGVQLGPLQPEVRDLYGVNPGVGVQIERVFGGPAKAAGLEGGDVIIGLGETEVRSLSQLQGLVERITPGSTEPLAVVRDGKRLNVDVKFEAMPDDFNALGDEEAAASSFDRFGLTVEELTGELAQAFGYPAETQGVVVTEIADDSPASQQLQVGDVIFRVGARPVATLAEFRRATESLDARSSVVLRVRRKDRVVLVVLSADDD